MAFERGLTGASQLPLFFAFFFCCSQELTTTGDLLLGHVQDATRFVTLLGEHGPTTHEKKSAMSMQSSTDILIAHDLQQHPPIFAIHPWASRVVVIADYLSGRLEVIFNEMWSYPAPWPRP